ncbi:GNAT family N-acetyltransferase [Rummeliibacillus pycnus]|uniref:GNAT family N-acetyltransferase n=1 Tax=Rummeliibacillus pycnus TaxID=101070 RepID=UPI0037C74C7F
MDYCLSKNIQPCWDCDIDNRASIHLDTNSGFKSLKKYAIYVKRFFNTKLT